MFRKIKSEFSESIKKEPQNEFESIDNWSNDIAELESYFENFGFPAQPIRLNQCSTITDIPAFVRSHLAIIKANNSKHHFQPYIGRLKLLRTVLN